jgi:thiamine-phosphate pyrophosphorylase
MKFIVITTDTVFDGEAAVWNRLFRAGMETLHVRKLSEGEDTVKCLLEQTDVAYHRRIVLHDHFRLASLFTLRGVHLSSRHPSPPLGVQPVSRSCHSTDELRSVASFQYVLLSPVFDSISKKGYMHAFPREILQEARDKHLINEKVIALGGIDVPTVSLAAAYGFGGVAVLGALWGNHPDGRCEEQIMRRFTLLQSSIACL